MSRRDVNFPRTGFVHQFGCTHDRARGADHVIEQQRYFSFDGTTDDRLLLYIGRATSTLVHDRQITTESFVVTQRAFDTAFVWADHDDIVAAQALLLEMLVQHRCGVEVINWNIKEALDLCRVQIHCEDSVCTGASDNVGGEFGRDRHAAFVFAVLPSVSEVRNDGGNPFGAGPLAAIDHDQQFKQVIVDRRRRWLNQEYVPPANVFVKFAVVFAVWEFTERDLGRFEMQVVANLVGQFNVGSSAEDF